jgi:hypothetical protein
VTLTPVSAKSDQRGVAGKRGAEVRNADMAFRLIVPKPDALFRKLAFGSVLFVARPIEQATIALRRIIADPADEKGCQLLSRRRQRCRERDDFRILRSARCSMADSHFIEHDSARLNQGVPYP